MSEKVVILVEDDLFKMEDMLLSIQSILFVAEKQNLSNAPKNGNTEICLLHVLDKDEKADSKIFEKFKAILEERQREYECELKYEYEIVKIDKNLYSKNKIECAKILCEKIEQKVQKREYSIVLDVILVKNESKDIDQVLKEEKILSHLLYEKFSENCIPYTTYDNSGQTFRVKWAEIINSELPYERFRLDGNVIHKGFKQKLYGQLKIGV